MLSCPVPFEQGVGGGLIRCDGMRILSRC
jgi:hypothetical protein